MLEYARVWPAELDQAKTARALYQGEYLERSMLMCKTRYIFSICSVKCHVESGESDSHLLARSQTSLCWCGSTSPGAGETNVV